MPFSKPAIGSSTMHAVAVNTTTTGVEQKTRRGVTLVFNVSGISFGYKNFNSFVRRSKNISPERLPDKK